MNDKQASRAAAAVLLLVTIVPSLLFSTSVQAQDAVDSTSLCKPPPGEIINDTVNENGYGSETGCTDTSHPQLANCRAKDGDKIFNWCCPPNILQPYSDTLYTCTKFGDPIPTVPSAPAPAPVAVPVPVPVPVPDDSNVVAPTPTATGVCTPSLDPNCEKYGDGSVLYTCTFCFFDLCLLCGAIFNYRCGNTIFIFWSSLSFELMCFDLLIPSCTFSSRYRARWNTLCVLPN